MKQKNIFVPTKDADSWKELLADKDKQWKLGFSAMSTAISWDKSKSIPPEIHSVISENPKFKDLELLLVLPEYKVDFYQVEQNLLKMIFSQFLRQKNL